MWKTIQNPIELNPVKIFIKIRKSSVHLYNQQLCAQVMSYVKVIRLYER